MRRAILFCLFFAAGACLLFSFGGGAGYSTTGLTRDGDGSGLTDLNASELKSGTVPQARLNSNLQKLEDNDGSSLTNLNGSAIASGTVADARIAATIARDSEVTVVSNAFVAADVVALAAATNAAKTYTQLYAQPDSANLDKVALNDMSSGTNVTARRTLVVQDYTNGIFYAIGNPYEGNCNVTGVRVKVDDATATGLLQIAKQHWTNAPLSYTSIKSGIVAASAPGTADYTLAGTLTTNDNMGFILTSVTNFVNTNKITVTFFCTSY